MEDRRNTIPFARFDAEAWGPISEKRSAGRSRVTPRWEMFYVYARNLRWPTIKVRGEAEGTFSPWGVRML